ncbi:MmgE/PrpD family protein [Chloroflexota bacterium]
MPKIMDGLVNYVVDTSYDDLPSEVIDYAKKLILSSVGGMIAGSIQAEAKIVGNYVKKHPGVPEATVVGGKVKTSAQDAALANGTFTHASELEDNYFPSGGSTFSTIPCALALAEALGSSGKDCLEAFIVGQEIGARVTGVAPGGAAHGFMPLSILGCAAVAAKLLKLDANKTANALSLSASYAGGLLRQSGAGAHFIEAGIAAADGITSALLAQDGFTGRPEIIECPGGLVDAMAGKDGYNFDGLIESLGKPNRVMEIGIKKYPCCWIEHRLIDGLLDIKKEYNLRPEDIASMEIYIGPYTTHLVRYHDPTTVEEGRFSFEHSFAAVLLEKDVVFNLVPWGSEEKLADSQYQKVQKALNIKEIIDNREWKVGAGVDELIVNLKNGKKYQKTIPTARGVPPLYLTMEEVVAKFNSCVDYGKLLSKQAAERVCQLILSLEKASNVHEIMSLLA